MGNSLGIMKRGIHAEPAHDLRLAALLLAVVTCCCSGVGCGERPSSDVGFNYFHETWTSPGSRFLGGCHSQDEAPAC